MISLVFSCVKIIENVHKILHLAYRNCNVTILLTFIDHTMFVNTRRVFIKCLEKGAVDAIELKSCKNECSLSV